MQGLVFIVEEEGCGEVFRLTDVESEVRVSTVDFKFRLGS